MSQLLLITQAALKIQHFFFQKSYQSRKQEILYNRYNRLNIDSKTYLPLLKKATLQSEQDIIRQQNSMQSEREEPQQEAYCSNILAKRQIIYKKGEKYSRLSLDCPYKSVSNFEHKPKLSATHSFLKMQLKPSTPIENQNSDQQSIRSSWSNFSFKQDIENQLNEDRLQYRNYAMTPMGHRQSQRFCENTKEERCKISSISNSSTSTLSTTSSRMKSASSMNNLHSNNSTFARQKPRNRNQSSKTKVNHPKGWGVRSSDWQSCDIANLMHMLDKAREDKQTSAHSKSKAEKKTELQQQLPIQKTPAASSSFLKIEENIQQIQASPQYFNRQRQQAKKISRKSSCHSSAKSDNHKRNLSDIQQNPTQTNKFITITQSKQFLNTTAQYMTPKSSDNFVPVNLGTKTPQSSTRAVNKKSNKRGWQTQIIEALTQNPPQFFDSNRLSTFAKHKLGVAQNSMKENLNPFLNSSHSKSTTQLPHAQERKRNSTPLLQQRSLKNLSINNINCRGGKQSDLGSSSFLNSSIIPQTCKHDLSLNFDFRLNQNQSNSHSQYQGKKMLNRPPSELKAISLCSDRKNQENLHAKSRSIQSSGKRKVSSVSQKNRRNNSSGAVAVNKNRFITALRPSSVNEDHSSNSFKLKKSKRYANVESKVKKMIEETSSASVIKYRPYPTQVCLPVSFASFQIEKSECLQNQEQQQQANYYDNKSPIQGSSEKRKASYLPFKRHKRQSSQQSGGVQLIGNNLFNQPLYPTNNVNLFERHKSVPKLGVQASLHNATYSNKAQVYKNCEIQNQQNLCEETASITPISSKNSRQKSSNLFVIMDNQCQQEEENSTTFISFASDHQNCSLIKSQKNLDQDAKLKELNDRFNSIKSSLEDDRYKQNEQILTQHYTHKTGKCVGAHNKKIAP